MIKNFFIAAIFILNAFGLGAQQREAAEKLVDEGVAYHDKQDYDGAIDKYDRALVLDKDNLLALTEKAFTLHSLQKYDESIVYCKNAIEKHPGDAGLKTVYVTYGNALDGLKKTDQSIEIYDIGLKQFPNYYQLHFNKGISLSSVKKYSQALQCFEKAVTLNPRHGSSHNAIARLNDAQENRIPAILAYCRFLALEPNSSRAKENLAFLQKQLKGNAEKTGKKSVTIHIDPKTLDTTAGKENYFGHVDLLLSLTSASDFDKKNKNKSEREKFEDKINLLSATLSEQKNTVGFYWKYYAPYFADMKANKQIETFSYIAFATSDDEDIAKWLKSNKEAIDAFFKWSKAYTWIAD